MCNKIYQNCNERRSSFGIDCKRKWKADIFCKKVIEMPNGVSSQFGSFIEERAFFAKKVIEMPNGVSSQFGSLIEERTNLLL